MKRKTALCSTGHGTGVLVMKAPSWPAKAKQRTRRLKKFMAKHRHEPRAENYALEGVLRKRQAERARERAKPVGLMAKLRRMFTRAT